MTPSLSHTYQAACAAISMATSDADFGSRFLLNGKSSALKGRRRETSISARMADTFVNLAAHAISEYPVNSGGRIDVAIVEGHLNCAIEVKAYFCHHCRVNGGHPYLRDTYWDFYKRAFLAVPLQAVLVVADVVTFPTGGRHLDLYNARHLAARLAKRGPTGFVRFERDLRRAFSEICEIYPETGSMLPPDQSWHVRYAGASAFLRAWVLGLKPTVTADELDALCKATTSSADYNRRLRKYRLARDQQSKAGS